MGTLPVTDLLNKAALLLQDVDNVRWSRAELLEYFNEAQRQIVAMQPHDNGTTATIALPIGSKQALPAGAFLLLDVLRNMGRNGATPARVARMVARHILDAADPYWHYSSSGPLVQNVVYDEQDPTTFFVYPPSDGNASLELRYVRTPDPVAEGDALTVNDVYEGALVEFILYRACSKEATWSPGPDRAAGHLSIFQQIVATKGMAEAANTANRNTVPQVPGTAPGGQS